MHKPSRGYSHPHDSLPNVRPQNAPSTLTPGPSCPSCPLSPETPSAPCKGNVSISQAPPAVFGGSAACMAPPKSARHPREGAASTGSSQARVSSPPEAKASWVRSSYGISFGTRGPLHPSWTLQRSTAGGGSAAPCPSACMGGILPLGKAALSQDSARSIIYLGAPQARGAATPLQALWSLKCRGGIKSYN